VGLRYQILDGYPHYRVGTDGSFWTLLVRGPKGTMVPGKTWKRLRSNGEGAGEYIQVSLTNAEGLRKVVSLHRLILLTFRGEPPPGKPWGAHNNGKKKDNRLVNLRWASPKENSADMVKHGTLRVGPKATKTKLTERQVIEIRRRVDAGEKMLPMCKEYKIRFSSLWAVAKRKSWKHIK
jgi:hypothetical protein